MNYAIIAYLRFSYLYLSFCSVDWLEEKSSTVNSKYDI